MKVNSRRANTCYKQTDEATDWISARAQCWSYGGDLAFPLPNDDEECRAKIFGLSKGEEVSTRGKSLLESWDTTFLPDWQIPLMFV